MKINEEPIKIGDLLNHKSKKPPAFQWQELALKVIAELSVPKEKRNSVFKVCKNNSRIFIGNCLNDTKELCLSGEKWKYFFKLINKK